MDGEYTPDVEASDQIDDFPTPPKIEPGSDGTIEEVEQAKAVRRSLRASNTATEGKAEAEKPAPDGDAEEAARAGMTVLREAFDEARYAEEAASPEGPTNYADGEPDEASCDTHDMVDIIEAVAERASIDDDEAKQTIDEIIEAAVGVSMAAFERRHPTTARYLIRRLGDPLEFTIEALKKDELYQQLIANTEDALDIANIIRVIVSVALSVAERLLIAL